MMPNSIEITDRYELIAVLQRYNNVEKVFDQPVSDFCLEQGLNPDFIEKITDAFHNPASFCATKMQLFHPEVILEYLERTHEYYLERLIPEIEQSLLHLINNQEVSSKVSIQIFGMFMMYRKDFAAHIAMEEKEFFPYVRGVIGGKSNSSYSLDQFQKEHIHQEDQLSEIRDFIVSVYPETSEQMPFEILLRKLDLLERDIEVHARIEDEVLVKMVED